MNDKAGITFLVARVIQIIVDAVAVEGQRGIAESKVVVASTDCECSAMRGATAAGIGGADFVSLSL